VNLAFEYIKYRWNAKGRHGTHSPFVYDFVDNCLTLKINTEIKKDLGNLFQTLKLDKTVNTIEDFGAGSKHLNKQRSISQIFNTSSSKGKFGELLFRLSKHYQPKKVLEFGTSLGIGTIHMSLGHPDSEIITVEADPSTREAALKNFQRLNCKNIISIPSTFNDFLKEYNGSPFDLIFIDGHHDGNALKNYLNLLDKHSHNDTIFILDDIRWSNSMHDAWNEIKSMDKYHVTMDLFRMGIVLKRSQQEKEHFYIRF